MSVKNTSWDLSVLHSVSFCCTTLSLIQFWRWPCHRSCWHLTDAKLVCLGSRCLKVHCGCIWEIAYCCCTWDITRAISSSASFLHLRLEVFTGPKRPVNMLHGTDPDPYFIWKWDPNPRRPEKCLKCTTRTRRGPDHYSKVGPEPGWEDTDPTHIAQQMLLSQ